MEMPDSRLWTIHRMGIPGSQSDCKHHPESKSSNRGRVATACIGTFCGIALVGLMSCPFLYRSKATKEKPAAPQIQALEAELVSTVGMILVCKPGRTEWQEVKTGARLKEGDLIQTDSSGSASIRYSNGTTVFIQKNTIFTVQNTSKGTMEITALPQIAGPESRTSPDAVNSDSGLEGLISSKAEARELQPSIELQRIIPFGRSLELVGYVEAGSKLVVNGEGVEIAGDGSFKHFTNPFPATARKVNLVMKVTDLAGKTRTLSTTYDFSSPGGNN
jgi:hypothetical protein